MAKEITGNEFLVKIAEEKRKLMVKINNCEDLMKVLPETDDNSIALGLIRAAVGKGKLLIERKIKQFEDMCKQHIKPDANNKFPTTIDDLHGFWEIVQLQIKDLDQLFENIEEAKHNNWVMSDEPTINKNQKQSKRLSDVSGAGSPSTSLERQEARRKELLELKRKGKSAIKGGSKSAESKK